MQLNSLTGSGALPFAQQSDWVHLKRCHQSPANVTTRHQLQNNRVPCLRRKRNPRPSSAGGAAALPRTPPGPGHGAAPTETGRASGRAGGRAPRAAPAPLGDLGEGSSGRGGRFLWKPVPHPRPSASARQPRSTRGRRGRTPGPAAPEGRAQRPRAERGAGPPPTSGPGRCAQAREASTRVRVPSGGRHV